MPRTLEGGVKLYTRGEWGASGQYNTPLGTVTKDIKHHFYLPDVPASATVSQEMSVMRGVEKYHISKGWRRISYNFVIFLSGRIYEGCGLYQMGAHTVGQNSIAKAVCYAWDGDKHPATHSAKMATRAIRKFMEAKSSITNDAIVRGHRDYAAKSCPGNKVYPELSGLTFGPVGVITDEDNEMLQKGDGITNQKNDQVKDMQHGLWEFAQVFNWGEWRLEKSGMKGKTRKQWCDGKFGNDSFHAVRITQRNLDLSDTGEYTFDTAAKMRAAIVERKLHKVTEGQLVKEEMASKQEE